MAFGTAFKLLPATPFKISDVLYKLEDLKGAATKSVCALRAQTFFVAQPLVCRKREK